MLKNPYFLAGIPFVLVFILYNFKWGSILVSLSYQLQVFLIIFILLLFVVGILMNPAFKNKTLENSDDLGPQKNPKNVVLLVLLLTFIEGLYFRGFPITGAVSYSDFGIPGIHPVILTFNSYILVSQFYDWGNCVRDGKRYLYRLYVALLFVPYIIEVNRGMMVMVIVASGIAFAMSSNMIFSIKKITNLVILSFSGIYLFGLAGNYRTNFEFTGIDKYFDSYYIMSLGGAQVGTNLYFLNPFYWGYIYLTSSLANLESTVSQLWITSTSSSLLRLTVVQFLPDFISKRIYTNGIDTSGTRINSEFTTGTVFNNAFYLYGWAGMIITAIVIIFLPIILYLILKNSEKKYYVVGFSFLGSMYVFLPFDNMLGFTGLSLPIFFTIVGAVKHKLYAKLKTN